MSFVLLLTGCYSHQVTTRALEDREVVFWLNDGSYIRAEAGAHHRVLGGYDVRGVLVEEDFYKKDFGGMVRDDQIKEITSRELDVLATVLVVGIPLVLFGVMVVGMSTSDFI